MCCHLYGWWRYQRGNFSDYHILSSFSQPRKMGPHFNRSCSNTLKKCIFLLFFPKCWIKPSVFTILGRFPRELELRSSSGSPCCVYLPKQWMGHQYPHKWTISKYIISSPISWAVISHGRFPGKKNDRMRFLLYHHLLGDGVVVKGRAYGIPSIRVDGNDALAVYNTVKRAREIAINRHTPFLIEVIIYLNC